LDRTVCGCCDEESFEKPSWTWRGKGLTAMPNPETAYNAQRYWPEVRNDWLGFYWIGLGNVAAEAAAAIPVEKINGPVLMISGGDGNLPGRLSPRSTKEMNNAKRITGLSQGVAQRPVAQWF
ncbi:MAG: hypothetical protein DRJ61_02890, partial [Acidobacteria bacterium]